MAYLEYDGDLTFLGSRKSLFTSSSNIIVWSEFTNNVCDKVFKTGPSKICLKTVFKKAFTWSFLEYSVPYNLFRKNNQGCIKDLVKHLKQIFSADPKIRF